VICSWHGSSGGDRLKNSTPQGQEVSLGLLKALDKTLEQLNSRSSSLAEGCLTCRLLWETTISCFPEATRVSPWFSEHESSDRNKQTKSLESCKCLCIYRFSSSFVLETVSCCVARACLQLATQLRSYCWDPTASTSSVLEFRAHTAISSFTEFLHG